MNYLKLVFLVLFVIPSVVVGQKVVNSNFLGNWANSGTGAWEYGFYVWGLTVMPAVFLPCGLMFLRLSVCVRVGRMKKGPS